MIRKMICDKTMNLPENLVLNDEKLKQYFCKDSLKTNTIDKKFITKTP